MTGKTHKVFGIVSNLMGGPQQTRDNQFERYKDQRYCNHVFGVIMDIDENGKAVDFTPIDFDGKMVRRWQTNTFGMGDDEFRAKKDTHFARVDKGIFFPITDETAEALKETIEVVASRLKEKKNDYYPSFLAKPKPEYERKGRAPLDFAGKPREGFDASEFERDTYARPRIATNCMQFLNDVLDKVAGVPIEDIVVDGKAMPRTAHTADLREYIDEVVGNPSRPWGTKKHNGRMVDLGEGRKAYFYDSQNGEICLTAAFNDPFKMEDSANPPIGVTLREAEPLFDAERMGQMLDIGPKAGASR